MLSILYSILKRKKKTKKKQCTYGTSYVYFDSFIIQTSRYPHPLCVAEFGESNLNSKIFTFRMNNISWLRIEPDI